MLLFLINSVIILSMSLMVCWLCRSKFILPRLSYRKKH